MAGNEKEIQSTQAHVVFFHVQNKMAPVDSRKQKLGILNHIIRERQRRKRIQQCIINMLTVRRRIITNVCLLSLLILSRARNNAARIAPARKQRSCRRFPRNQGWWENVWRNYSEKRFKKTFRVSRATFLYILSKIQGDIEKESLAEPSISPDCRLAMCLYRLGRGDYLYTISELTGYGTSTVCEIVNQVSTAIVNNMWNCSVSCNFPKDTDAMKNCMVDMEAEWQFPCCFGALDGCHIPIKCPSGGLEACKEYHNFKNFYSIVLMALIDSKYRFIWASAGFPGNSHDSVILQATELYHSLTVGDVLPPISKNENGVDIHPLILGDSAFPLKKFLMKPYTNAVLTPEQKYFNFRLSRARMVTEGAYGQLKGRWRILYRKCESSPDNVKIYTLACIVLHNICIDRGDTSLRQWDLSKDPQTNKRRPREEVRDLICMRNCRRIADPNSQACRIREALKQKFWLEKQGHGVN